MRTRRLAPVLLALCGCANSAGEASGSSISACDGSDRPKLVYEARSGGLVSPEMQMFYEVPLLVVDGRCNYFVHGGQPEQNEDTRVKRWPEVHTGHLTPSEAQRLFDRLHYTAWKALAGSYQGEQVYDHNTTFGWSNGADLVTCTNDCSGGQVPAPVREMARQTRELIPELWKKGAASAGAARVRLHKKPETSVVMAHIDASAMAWPLTRAPQDLMPAAYHPQTNPNEAYPSGALGLLVDDPQDAATLRALRNRYQDSVSFLWGPFQFIPVKATADAAGYQFELYLRDAMPFEDGRGLVSLRW